MRHTMKATPTMRKTICSAPWSYFLLSVDCQGYGNSEVSLCGGLYEIQGQEPRSDIFGASMQKTAFN